MKETVLCADIGTTSLKAALIDSCGTAVSFSRQPYENTSYDAAASQWLPALVRACRSMQDTISSVCALCISGNGPTIVAASGETLLWNAPLMRNVPATSSASPDPSVSIRDTRSLFIPRIVSFRNIYPELWKKHEFIFSGPEYLLWLLTGSAVTILPEDRYAPAYWTEDDLAVFGIAKEKLPPFVPPAFRAGNLKKDAAALLGIRNTVPVFCGGPDFIVALIGTDTLESGKLCDCAGSSEGINLCTERPLTGNGIRTLPSVIHGLWNAGVLFPSSGRLFADYKDSFEKETGSPVTYEELVRYSMEHPESEGWHIMDMLSKRTKEAVQTLKTAADEQHMTVASFMAVTGGQAKSSMWMQLKSNAAGMTVKHTSCPDAELTGDAVLAQVGLGHYPSIVEAAASLVKFEHTYTPQ